LASALFGKCHGVSTEAIEYRVRETAASAFWVPMRFQGQYLDDETELLENWNRFYDPPSGKYLEPDPVLAEHPEAIAEAAKRGIQINPYAYAGNNPINKIDLDGRQTGPEDAALFFFGMSEVLIDAAIALSTAAAVGCAISGTCADLVEDLMRKIQEATKEKTKEGVDVCPPKKDCYPQYLKDTAECGSLYTDDVEYEACMAQAWKNYIRCLNGLPWQPMRR
jgi:RHS repeat-associated protein